jgi:hypothetical protein
MAIPLYSVDLCEDASNLNVRLTNDRELTELNPKKE